MNAKSKLTVAAMTICVLVTCIASAVAYWSWTRPEVEAKSFVVAIPSFHALATTKPSVKKNAGALKAHSLAETPQFDPTPLAVQLSSDDQRGVAIQRIEMMSIEQPDLVAQGMPVWLGPLMDAGAYDDVLALTSVSILAKPHAMPAVSDQQRARVIALLHQGSNADALAAAKSYYNIVPLADSDLGIELIVDTLNEDSTPTDPTVTTRFKMEQTSPSKAVSVFNSIHVDSSLYAEAIKHPADNGDTYDLCMGRGNVLLLADRPADALAAFEQAWKPCGRNQPRTEAIVESMARATRDQYGAIQPANEFLLAIRSGKQTIPGADPLTARSAASHIPLANIPALAVPDIELRREEAEPALHHSSSDPQIVTGFECSTPGDVRKLSPTHYEISITTQGYRDWFMFQIVGAAGKTLRIDLTGEYVEVAKKWSTLNPVYAYADNLSDPSLYLSAPGTDALRPALNGPILPATDGQRWHYIPNVWREGRRTLSFVMKFDQDRATIAMRVPYLPTYNEAYLRQLAMDHPVARLVEAGRSSQNRPLLVVEIGADSSVHTKPVVVIYAREHADEQDSSWAAQGAINFLVSDDPRAINLCNRFTYLIIPVLDPDSAVLSQHEVMMTTFLPGRTTPESIAWSNWFKSWIDAGNRLDVVYDLHNIQSSEEQQISCPILEGIGERGKASVALHALLTRNLSHCDIVMSPHRPMRGLMPDRLGGWLSITYGPINLAYELNSQAPNRHLNLSDLRSIGACMAQSTGQFLSDSDGMALMANVDVCRRQRLDRWANSDADDSSTPENAIESEARHATGISGEHPIAAGEELIP